MLKLQYHGYNTMVIFITSLRCVTQIFNHREIFTANENYLKASNTYLFRMAIPLYKRSAGDIAYCHFPALHIFVQIFVSFSLHIELTISSNVSEQDFHKVIHLLLYFTVLNNLKYDLGYTFPFKEK